MYNYVNICTNMNRGSVCIMVVFDCVLRVRLRAIVRVCALPAGILEVSGGSTTKSNCPH